MTTKAILEYVKSHPSGKVKIAYADMDGILRGKYIATEKFLSAVEGGTAFCDVIFGWDANDVAYDNVKHTGCTPAIRIHLLDWISLRSERFPGKIMYRFF